jgi:hypothetical protein
MDNKMSEETRMLTSLIIGGGLCAFVFIGIIAMAIAATYYGKKEGK